MKAIFVVVVLLFGCTNAKPNPAKRSSLTCKNLPKKISGREYVMTVTDSGSTVTEITFNMDVDLQIANMESTVDGQGPYGLLMDYKGGKMYVSYPGGCYSSPLKDKFPLSPEAVNKDLKFEVSGVLGLNGGSVDLYSYSNEQGNGTFTFQGDDSCLPVSFADKSPDSATAGSFLDMKTTADPEKLKVPVDCHEQDFSRRSIPAMVHAVHLKEAMKRVFPWIEVPLKSKKRGFPGHDSVLNSRKRGFSWNDSVFNSLKLASPWIELQNNRKRGFPWPFEG